MKKELPFVIPITACYPATSEAAGILFADEYISNWMYNNFIQLFQVENNGAIDYYDFAIDNNPYLSYNELSYSFINNNWNSIIDFVISCINDDYYVRLFNNMSKNPLYGSANEIEHDMLVLGYDDNKKIFKVADHFKKGKFCVEECSYEQLKDSVDTFEPRLFETNPAFLNSVQIIQKENNLMRLRFSMYTSEQMDYLLALNVERIILSLQDYVSCIPTTNWYTRGRAMDEKLASTHKWGIDCYDVIKEQVKIMDKSEGQFIFQSCYVINNHKTVMIERINRIANKYVFPEKDVHIKKFKSIQGLTERLMMLIIKLKCARKKDILIPRICDLIDEIKRSEYDYINELIKDLKKIDSSTRNGLDDNGLFPG